MSESHLRDCLLIYSSLIYTTFSGDLPADSAVQHSCKLASRALLPFSLPGSSFSHSSSFSHFSSPSSLVPPLLLSYTLFPGFSISFSFGPSSLLMLGHPINLQLEVSNTQRRDVGLLSEMSQEGGVCMWGPECCLCVQRSEVNLKNGPQLLHTLLLEAGFLNWHLQILLSLPP